MGEEEQKGKKKEKWRMGGNREKGPKTPMFRTALITPKKSSGASLRFPPVRGSSLPRAGTEPTGGRFSSEVGNRIIGSLDICRAEQAGREVRVTCPIAVGRKSSAKEEQGPLQTIAL